MATYLSLKSILMAAAIIGAFSLFFVRGRRLVRLMTTVQGRTDATVDRLADRLRVFCTDVLGQANVRRKLLPGVSHTLIFFGFLAVQPHSLELMLRGVFPGVHVAEAIPRVYGAYLFVADILGFLVLAGLGYALYRRLVLRPAYLTNGRDARLIIFFITVIIVTFHLLNAFLILPSIGGTGFDYRRVFTVSKALEEILGLQNLSPAAARAAYEAVYWIHILVILGFLVYIPGSKHLHMLAAIPNVFLKPLERPKPMFKTDLETEGAQTYGLGKVSDLSWKAVLDLYACTECGRCDEQCPAAMTGKPLSPKQVVHDAKADLLQQSDAILARSFDTVKPFVREDSPITADVLWSCTSCRACEEICPVNIQHLDILLEARKHQVLMEASFPPEMQDTFTHLDNQSNPWGFGSDTRGDWARDLDVPRMCDRPEAELLFYVGCAGSFDDRGKKISQAMARVLKKAGVDFAILGEEERCNGDLARRAGNEYLAQMMIQENAAVLNQYQPKRILAGCPHCYNTLKHEYPQFGARFEVLHATEFILQLFRQGRLTVAAAAAAPVAFHDSCYLGRWNGIFEAPRELLRIIGGGAGPVELRRSADKGLCCGAGGGRMFMEERIGKRINAERADDILASGAATAAAACPFCITMLRDGLADCGSPVEVRDIVELVDIATG
jgi:Fe-S oxidoreductase/nitrate reductase gamma subunit